MTAGAAVVAWALDARNSIEPLEQRLSDLREAHHDLDQGMLHVTLSDGDDSPFSRETGLAYFDQALHGLRTLRPQIEALNRTAASPVRSDFGADTERLEDLVAHLPDATTVRESHTLLDLRAAFHRLNRHLHETELQTRAALRDQSRRLERRLLVTSVVSGLLLVGLLGGAFALIRRLRLNTRQIHLRETLLSRIGDNLPDAYVYQWQRLGDAPPRFTHLTKGVERVHGVSRDEALANPQVLFDQLAPATRTRLFVTEHEQGEALTPLELDIPFTRADGAPRILAIRSRPHRLPDGTLQWDGICADVTEQRQRDQAHRQLDAELKEISELARIGTWSFDPDTGEGFWSDEVARIHDLSPADPASRDIGLQVYPEPWKSQIETAIAAAVEHARPYELELFMVTPRGRRKWVRTLGFPVTRGGRVVRVRGTIQDITERKLARLQLAESEAQFRLLFEEAADGLVVLSRRHRVHEINQHLLELLGRERHELLNQPLADLVAAADRERLQQRLSAIDTGDTTTLELQLLCFEGPPVDTEIAIRRLSNERLVCIVRDLTRRRLAERRSALHGAVTTALAHAVRLDETAERVIELFCEYLQWDYGVFWRVNAGRTHLNYVAHWYAHDRDLSDVADLHREVPVAHGREFAGRIWARRQSQWESLPGTDAAAAADAHSERLQEIGIQSRIGFPVTLREDTLGVFEFHSLRARTPRTDLLNFVAGLGTQFGLYLERLRLDQSVLQAQKMEAIGTLAGGVAHDFNNLLSAIVGHTDLALYTLANPAEAKDNLTQVKQASSRAAELVRQLLTLSRRTEEAAPERRIPVDLAATIRETVSFLRASAPPAVRIAADLPDDLPAILADPTQLQQVLMNLGTNAWQAMRDRAGSVTFAVRAMTRVSHRDLPRTLEPGTYLHLTVVDTGPGMDAATRERIFEPFFTTKERTGGTGLGLAVVHAIMRGHQGSISVESEPGHGTTFHLYFPATSEASRPPELEDVVETLGGRGETLLVVDDEASVARPVQRLLERAHYHVELCLDPASAVDLVAADAGRFDLVLTDYAMPEFDGLELTRRVKRFRADLPVVLTTGLADALSSDDLQAAGVDTLLRKPATTQKLLQAVHQTLQAGRES